LKLIADVSRPRIYFGPVAIIASAAAERIEQQATPGRPMIEIDNSGKDSILFRLVCAFEFPDLFRLFLDQSADDGMSIAE